MKPNALPWEGSPSECGADPPRGESSGRLPTGVHRCSPAFLLLAPPPLPRPRASSAAIGLAPRDSSPENPDAVPLRRRTARPKARDAMHAPNSARSDHHPRRAHAIHRRSAGRSLWWAFFGCPNAFLDTGIRCDVRR